MKCAKCGAKKLLHTTKDKIGTVSMVCCECYREAFGPCGCENKVTAITTALNKQVSHIPEGYEVIDLPAIKFDFFAAGIRYEKMKSGNVDMRIARSEVEKALEIFEKQRAVSGSIVKMAEKEMKNTFPLKEDGLP